MFAHCQKLDMRKIPNTPDDSSISPGYFALIKQAIINWNLIKRLCDMPCHSIFSDLATSRARISNWNINIELRNFNLTKCHIPVLLSFRTVEKQSSTIKLPLFAIKANIIVACSDYLLRTQGRTVQRSAMNRLMFVALVFLSLGCGAFAFFHPEAVSFSPKAWFPRDLQRLEALSLQSARRRPKPLAFSDGKGMVAGTSSSLAVHAGTEALKKGGNAMDACLTTALTGTTSVRGSTNTFKLFIPSVSSLVVLTSITYFRSFRENLFPATITDNQSRFPSIQLQC